MEGNKLRILRWFGHIERRAESEMTKRMYKGMIDVVKYMITTPLK